MDESALAELLNGAFHVRQIGNAEAFLIALDEAHPTYGSPNYLWFKARYRRFVYVDRVVVAPQSRGKGYARLLYAELIEQARRAGHKRVVCEVNRLPPNPASDAFHAMLGFHPVGEAALFAGTKHVRYLALPIDTA